MRSPAKSAGLRGWAVIASLVLTASLGGSGCANRPRPRPPTPPGAITNQQRIQAMLSIHAHARWPDANFKRLPFLELRDAVQILSRDHGPAADSRRRRAVAKLAAYGLGREDFRRAISDLGVDPDGIVTLLRREPRVLEPPEAEVIIVNSLTSVTPACPWQVAGGPTGGVPNPPPVQWSFDVLIPRPVDAIARALDPQSWPKCNPFFQETYLAATSSSCCSKATTATSAMTATCTPKLGPTGDPQAASAEPVGKPYGPTALYEHACIADDCSSCPGPTRCDVDFANLLCIDTHYDKPMPFSCMTSGANRYDVGYKLASWLRGELLGQEQQQITDDHGGLSATRATDKEKVGLPGNDWSVVHVDKTLDFQDSNVTGAVGKYMQALRDELAWQIAEHACCDVAKECWLFAW